MQNLGGQTKSIIVFSEMAHCNSNHFTVHVYPSQLEIHKVKPDPSCSKASLKVIYQSKSALLIWDLDKKSTEIKTKG